VVVKKSGDKLSLGSPLNHKGMCISLATAEQEAVFNVSPFSPVALRVRGDWEAFHGFQQTGLSRWASKGRTQGALLGASSIVSAWNSQSNTELKARYRYCSSQYTTFRH
jgi:hypothetical protein